MQQNISRQDAALTRLHSQQSVAPSATPARCRFCNTPMRHTFVDLGMSPLCESFVKPEALNGMEPFYPLRVYVCYDCFLVQLQEYVSPGEIFSGEYAYFSAYSDTWLEHSRRYTEKMIGELGLAAESRVVEVASNDGYLLQYFVQQGIPCLGLEPASNVAAAARRRGVNTQEVFFGTGEARRLVEEGWQADLMVANNVLAHVHDINDFVAGFIIALAPRGVATFEFPHLLRLVADNQFDTIYHEHYSYFSFYTVQRIFTAHGLTIFDVEELPTHGGSLRIYAAREGEAPDVTDRVEELRRREIEIGITDQDYYQGFEEKVRETKRALLEFLIGVKRKGCSVVGYGAPGKGNTLLNYCGIGTDFLDYTVDRSTYKHGLFTPGTHIPVYPTNRIRETHPDYVLILPWNLKDEIMSQMADVRKWGGKFIVPIPELQVFP